MRLVAVFWKLSTSSVSYTHLEPYENMPAADVGLKAGDILMEIDGKDLAGKNNQEVSEMLRGQVGTSFKPVSYTHLDVYKRQGMSFEWMMQGIAEAIWISSVTRIFDVLSLSKYLSVSYTHLSERVNVCTW